MRRFSRGAIGVIVCALVLELGSRAGGFDPRYVPPASVVLVESVRALAGAAFWNNLAATLAGWALGLGLSIAIAIPAGIVLGNSNLAYRVTRPMVEFMRPIPAVALIPPAILLFGQGLQMKVVLAAWAAIWPMLFNTIYGVHNVDPVALETARAFGFGRIKRILKVTLPSAAPLIATGVRVSSAIALVVVVSAEFLAGGESGLGAWLLALEQRSGEFHDGVGRHSPDRRARPRADNRVESGRKRIVAMARRTRLGLRMTAVDGKGTRAGLSRLASYLFATLEAVVVIAALATVWQLAAVLIGSPYFPPIVAVLARMVEKWFSGPAYFLFIDPIFITDIIPSIGRAILAFAICGVLGVGIGLALGLSRSLSDFVDPIVHFARSLPAVTLLPLFLLLLGLDTKMKLSFIVFGAIWPVVLNTMHGVRAIDPLALETARVFLVPWRRRIFQVVLPAASPEIFAGLRVSLSLALILMVVSEMVAATGGLGFSIVQAQRTFAIRDMWAGVVVLGLAGYLLNGVFLAVENALLRWHRAASGRLVQ